MSRLSAMDSDTLILIYIVTTLVALLISYVVIRFAVQHGTGAALRAHEVWMRDGSLDRAMDARAASMLADGEFQARTER